MMRYSAAHWKSVKQFCLLASMPAKEGRKDTHTHTERDRTGECVKFRNQNFRPANPVQLFRVSDARGKLEI